MQITPSIHAIRHSFSIPNGPGITLDRFVYSYLVYGDTITLIDTGVAGCEKDIFEYIRLTGRDPSEIALIILTHSHPDRSGRPWKFSRRADAASRHTRRSGHGLKTWISKTANDRYRGSQRSWGDQ